MMQAGITRPQDLCQETQGQGRLEKLIVAFDNDAIFTRIRGTVSIAGPETSVHPIKLSEKRKVVDKGETETRT